MRLACVLSLVAGLWAGAACAADAGWWVVVGSFPPEQSPEQMLRDYNKVNAAVARCGFTSFNDFSWKFEGFRPDFHVFVVGPYPDRAKAEAARKSIGRCVPNAYVKYGRHLGE